MWHIVKGGGGGGAWERKRGRGSPAESIHRSVGVLAAEAQKVVGQSAGDPVEISHGLVRRRITAEADEVGREGALGAHHVLRPVVFRPEVGRRPGLDWMSFEDRTKREIRRGRRTVRAEGSTTPDVRSG